MRRSDSLVAIGWQVVIIHVDMDAFYASVEIRDNPKLVGLPVVVGGSPQGRGVVSAASYEARKFGIHSAMPAARVLQLCPQAVFIRPRMEHYAQISKRIREIFGRFTSIVEPLSLDEAFLDVTGCERLFGNACHIAEQIKSEIRDELNLVASAGVAPNKYLAKVASDVDKPDGLVVVEPDQVLDFLTPLAITRIWGVGKKCAAKFRSVGVTTIGHLRELSLADLKPMFGVNSQHFWNLARGIDSREVVPDRIAKSISHESTFAADITSRATLEAWLIELLGQVARRMRRFEIRGRTLQLKLRFSDFRTITRAATFDEPTHQTKTMVQRATELLRTELPADHAPIRLLGAGMHNLIREKPVQLHLFDQVERDRQANLDETSDQITERFGHSAIRSGKVLEQQVRHRSQPRIDSDPKGSRQDENESK